MLQKNMHAISHTHVDTSTYRILTGEVELVTRSELLSVAATPSQPLFYAAVNGDTQTVVVTESTSIRLDWLKLITEVLGASAVNASYTFRRAQLDEYRNPIGPLDHERVDLPSQNRIAAILNVEADAFYIQVILL